MATDQSSLVQLGLTAAGFEGLYAMLQEVSGLQLGSRYILRELYAMGGQSLLWLTDDLAQPERPVLARMALLPYHRPAYLTDAIIQQARGRIEYEARLLEQFSDTSLPKLCGLFRAHNPLQPPERGREITETEPYLVMELVRGSTILEMAQRWRQTISPQTPIALATLTLSTAEAFAGLSCTLYDRGYIYADVTPRNMLVSEPPTNWRVRVVDAGSIISTTQTADNAVPFSWAYISPEYYAAYKADKRLWPTPTSVMYALGKTLWQLLTGRQPMPGEHPDLKEPILSGYPLGLTLLVQGLIGGHYGSFAKLQAVVTEMRSSSSWGVSDVVPISKKSLMQQVKHFLTGR